MYVPLSDHAIADVELIRRATLQNDQGAYAALMERYWRPLHFTMLKLVQASSDADDLTIEAFAKAFRQLHTYTPQYSFSTWLFKIATNNGVDYMRRQRSALLSLEATLNEQNDEPSATTQLQALCTDEPDPEEQYIVTQRNHLLRELLEQMSDRYRQVIELRFFEELSYEEMAARLEIPIGTIKSNIHRAKELLYDVLKPQQET